MSRERLQTFQPFTLKIANQTRILLKNALISDQLHQVVSLLCGFFTNISILLEQQVYWVKNLMRLREK